MAAESIFSNLTAETTAAEISLILSADHLRRRTVVLLEGEDDIRLFRFLVSADVTLIKAYGASTTIDKFMPANFPDEKRVIGIRDRDYQKKKRFPRIFYCDHCCCEMMLVADPETFGRVAVNFYRGNTGPEQLRRELLEKLFFLSSARRLSAELGLNIRVSGTDLKRMLGPDVAPTAEAVLAFLSEYNDRDKLTPTFRRELRSLRAPSDIDELLDITNGHDFVAAFCIYCNASTGGRYSLSERELGGALRSAYSLAAFATTDLHAELAAYGRENNLSITRD